MIVKRMIVCLTTFMLIVGLITAVIGCGKPITGSGKVETRETDYTGFAKLTVGSGFEVEITRADSFSVSITADDNLFDYLDIKKVGSTLYIGLKRPRIYLHTTQRATITMPDLRGLELSGTSRGDVNGFSSADSLTLGLSGASYLRIDNVKAGSTGIDVSGASKLSGSITIADGNFSVSGASTIELEGTAGNVDIEVSGVSSVKIGDLAVVNAAVEVSGVSKATTNASDRIDANISGASTLYYVGNPTLGDIEVSSGSKISQR